MGRASVALTACIATLLWSCAQGQDNDTCTTESCGVTSCGPGFELEVLLDSDSLIISCEGCDEDYYKPEEGADPCIVCPDGLVSNGSASVCTLEEGYWRVDDSSVTVYECPNSDACVGGSDAASYCADGFEGPLCAVCTNDYYPSGSFECLECSEGNAASALITIILFVAVLALFIVVLIKAAEKVEEKAREDENDHGDAAEERILSTGTDSKLYQFVKQWKDTLVVRFKIIVAHFQIVTTFPAVLDVQWPEAFNRYADKVSVISLDFWGILSQSCFFRPDYLKQLVFTTLLPLGIVVILIAYYFKAVKSIGASPAARRAAWDRTAGGVLLTGFFFYIVTSTLILEAFDCQDFEDGSSYLKADYRISCDSDMYTFIYGYAISMAIIFPAGIPLTYLVVLYVGRSRINPEPLDVTLSYEMREEDPTIQKTKFLWGTYRPHVYYYEVWECVRKLFLTGLLVYFEEGTSTQVVIAMLITLAGLRVLAGLRPYRREDENNLAEASLWITFLTLFAGLLIKSEVTEVDGYDTIALGVVLSIMNAALVGLAIFQILWTTSEFFNEKIGEVFGVSGDGNGGKDMYSRRTRPPPEDFEPRGTRPQSNRPAARPQSNRPATRPLSDRPVRSPIASANVREGERFASRGHTDKAAQPAAVPPRGRSPVSLDHPISRKNEGNGKYRPGSTT